MSGARSDGRRPRLLVSAGPSLERIDDVRFLSNGATGLLGIEIARAGAARGFDVCLLLGPTVLAPPQEVHCLRFESARELDELARTHWDGTDAFVATAAVMDYRPAERIAGKRKKAPGDWELRLVRNPDVLAGRAAEKGHRILVGCALESSHDLDEARRKLHEKHLDLILLNGPANLASREGSYTWLARDGSMREFPSVSKVALALEVVDFLAGKVGVLAPE